MDTNYNADQEAFRDSLRRLLADKFDQGFTRKQWDEAIPHEDGLWEALVELGIPAMLVPEAQGGLGMGMVDMGVVMEELGRRVTPAPVLSSCVGATSLAVACEQNELLEQLATGEVTATVAMEEAESSLLNWKTPSVSASNNQLSGTKVQVLDGISADKLFVSANDGIYLLESDAEGLEIDLTDSIDGSRRYASLALNNTPAVKVGELELLGPVIDRMLVALCADALGAAEMALFMTLEYAKEREQFDVPIGSFQAVQHMAAEMFQQVEMARAGLHYALWALDCAEPEEAHRAAIMIKSFVSEYFPKVGADAIQVFGGAGFTWEYDVQLYYKRLMSAELLLGNGGVWFEELARQVIDQ